MHNYAAVHVSEEIRDDAPSGNRPFSPVSVFLPKNQPSPKSSSRSISSMRSPRLRLSSSGLRAINSSARAHVNNKAQSLCAQDTILWQRDLQHTRRGERGGLTHYHEGIARPAALGVGALRHGRSCSLGVVREGRRCSAEGTMGGGIQRRQSPVSRAASSGHAVPFAFALGGGGSRAVGQSSSSGSSRGRRCLRR